MVDDFLKDEWSGSATELCDALKLIDPDADVTPLNIKKKLRSNSTLLNDNGIAINLDDRNGSKRLITLTRPSEQPSLVTV